MHEILPYKFNNTCICTDGRRNAFDTMGVEKGCPYMIGVPA